MAARCASASPDKVVFPEPGLTKLDLVRYYLAVADGALRGAGGRPMVLKRFVKGIDQEAFFQKRVPENHPDLIDTATLHYASGNSAEEVGDPGCRRASRGSSTSAASTSTRTPCAPRTSTTPTSCASTSTRCPGVDWSQIVDVAMVAREVLDRPRARRLAEDLGLARPAHLRAHRAATGTIREVRLAAETLAREVENRAPGLATARWWKEERGESVFVDFNQNAKDRTVASAYSIRPLPDARVSTPLDWDEVRGSRPERVHRARPCSSGSPSAATPPPASTTPSAASTACCALAEELGPAEKRAARRSATARGRRQSTMPLIEIARTKTKPEALEALERVEGAASRRRRRCCSRPTCSSTACAARARSGTASA